MSGGAPVIDDGCRRVAVDGARRAEEQSQPASGEPAEEQLIMHLERDQFVAETSRPLPPATLSVRATLGLWALRVFVVLVGLMVVYTFVEQLH